MKINTDTEKHRANSPRQHLSIFCVMGIGIAISIVLYVIVNNWEQEDRRTEFESIVKGYANAVQNSLKDNVEALLFLGDFFDNSTFVTRQEFSKFVKSVLPRYPSIQAFSWNPLVADSERPYYESLAKKDGFENFEFTETTKERKIVRAAKRKEYVVVYYIEPLETNKPAFGFDIASNPTRLKAINKAFASAKLSATERITLVQETGNQFGILLLLPIYHKVNTLNNIEERQKNRKGFVVEVLRIGDVIETALKAFSDAGVNLAVYDLSADTENSLLYFRRSKFSLVNEASMKKSEIQRGLYWKRSFELGGRQWKMIFYPTRFFLKSRHLWHSWMVLSSSLLLTCMLTFYLYKRARYTAEIERKVAQEIRINQKLADEISERKQAEEKATRFGHILERSVNEIYIFNADNFRFLQVNKGARENLGYSMQELQNLTPLDLKPEFTLESFLSLIEPLRFGKKSVIIFDTVHRRKDGSLYPVEVHLQYVAFNSTPVFVSIIIDITEKQRMKDQLWQAQKMEAIGTLAGGIAHDFNNILSAIVGYTELALIDSKEGSSQHNNLQEVLRAGGRAKYLIKQILAFSRQVQQERKPVQVKLIVKEALQFLRASLPTTIEIQQDIQSEALVMADPTQIHQIIMNLCTNAEHAMREKGGVLGVKLVDTKLKAGYEADRLELEPGMYLELIISDTGHGIPPHILDRIFDPFFTTKEPGEGTGMGLSVVHGIARSCEGAINAASQVGIGSTFRVYLPIIDRQLEQQDLSEGPVPTGTERILFVDDEPALANIGDRILNSLGYQVTTLTSSVKALALFKANPDRFDLVITDMSMPNMSGDALSAELMKVRAEIPVILYTGYSSKISDESALKIGIKAFVYKPITKNELAQTIRKVLDEAKTTDK